MYFQTADFFVLNSLTANIQFLKIQLQVFKMKKKIGTSNSIFKGAVCRILTLLKHKNTIICLQIFKKHAKITYLFIWKTMLQSVILLWKCAFRPGMSGCVRNGILAYCLLLTAQYTVHTAYYFLTNSVWNSIQ